MEMPGESQSLFVVKNDRPQAGNVQYDNSINLLIDRRVRTIDGGGVDEKLSDRQHEPLHHGFKIGTSVPI